MNDASAPSSPEPDDQKELGERLRVAREYLGLSQANSAEYLKVSRPAITDIESGKRKVSGLELKRLATLYKRPYEYFLGEKPAEIEDESISAIYRATKSLSDADREQVRKFAEFLKDAGPPPGTKNG